MRIGRSATVRPNHYPQGRRARHRVQCVKPAPHKALADHIQSAYGKTPIRLEALFDGAAPFAQHDVASEADNPFGGRMVMDDIEHITDLLEKALVERVQFILNETGHPVSLEEAQNIFLRVATKAVRRAVAESTDP